MSSVSYNMTLAALHFALLADVVSQRFIPPRELDDAGTVRVCVCVQQ